MGADIHLFTEVKRTINGTERWVNSDSWEINPYYRYGSDEDRKHERELNHKSIYSGRNYELFGILADVRGVGNPVISEPKGLPEDVSDVVKNESDRWGSDGHSHSYLTLREMVEYLEKYPKIKYEGFISPEEARKLAKTGETPNSWAGWANPDLKWVHREWEEDSAVKYLVDKVREKYKEVFWTRPEDQTPEDEEKIRIVFWFDN